MNFNFAEDVRGALAAAREAALEMAHDYVGTEHLLLGVAREGTAGGELLARLGAPPESVRAEVARAVPRGLAARRELGDLPYNGRAKRVLELTMQEARERGADTITVRELLAGLIREDQSVGARVLALLGVTLDGVRGASPSSAEPLVTIDDASERSIFEQIVQQVQEAAATGRVTPGERLPSVRALADQLDVAPGTVARAWAELERLGVVVTDGARGTRVAGRAPAAPEVARVEELAAELRASVVNAYHRGATAADLFAALRRAMRGIFSDPDAPAGEAPR